MEKDNEPKGLGNSYDFGARIYDSRLGRWLSVDPLAHNMPFQSPYQFASNSPIYRLDPDGNWDVTVHAFEDRTKFGYGIAVVTDRRGNEIMRFIVRLEGTGGTDRMRTNANTPAGVYNIPKDAWISGGSRMSYGPNHRLALEGESGEIVQSGRSAIRIHGGRQETYDAKTGTYTPVSNPILKKTHGCMRCFDADIDMMKTLTDDLEESDELEAPGKLTIKHSLIEYKGSYYIKEDLDFVKKEEETLNQVKSSNASEGGDSKEVKKQEQNVENAKSSGIN